MERLDYKNFNVIETNPSQLEKLYKIGNDSSGWLEYYTDKTNNYILFYPFSSNHGGGQAYLINILENKINDWIEDNFNFIEEIKFQLEKNGL